MQKEVNMQNKSQHAKQSQFQQKSQHAKRSQHWPEHADRAIDPCVGQRAHRQRGCRLLPSGDDWQRGCRLLRTTTNTNIIIQQALDQAARWCKTKLLTKLLVDDGNVLINDAKLENAYAKLVVHFTQTMTATNQMNIDVYENNKNEECKT